jgi:hypothetical protein
MKNLLEIASIIGLTVITQIAYSAEVTDTFTTGDTLTAEKLNSIKSAVNDNDTRIDGISSCTAIQGTGSATISCDDNSMASVYSGTTTTGNAQGDMQYFDGLDWVLVSAPTENAASLSFCGGEPTWTQGGCPVIGADCNPITIRPDADLRNCDLAFATLSYFTLAVAGTTHAEWLIDLYSLTGANLTGANLSYAVLTGTDLTDADLTNARLVGANMKFAKLFGADLSGTDMTGTDLREADLVYANLTDADLTGATFTMANLFGADLTGADLTDAEIVGINGRWDAIWSNTTCPNGNINVGTDPC